MAPHRWRVEVPAVEAEQTFSCLADAVSWMAYALGRPGRDTAIVSRIPDPADVRRRLKELA